MKKYEQTILKIKFDELKKDEEIISKRVSINGEQGYRVVSTTSHINPKANDSFHYLYIIMEREK